MHMHTCEAQRMKGNKGTAWRGLGGHVNSVYHCIININVIPNMVSHIG